MSKFFLYVVPVVVSLFYFGCKQDATSYAKSETQSKPNVLFIFTDDQGFYTLNDNDNKVVQTPNMDRLVRQGTMFTHAYNMGAWNGAVCAASRAMLLSGRHVWNAKKISEQWREGNSIQNNWATLMKGAGYRTYMTGKWHVEFPAKAVFDTVTHVRPGMPADTWEFAVMKRRLDSIQESGGTDYGSIMPIGYNRPRSISDTMWLPTKKKFGGFWEGGKHWSEVVADDAVHFLQDAKNRKEPFFMYLAFNAPHDPRQAPKEFQELYTVDSIPLPKSYRELHPYRKVMQSDEHVRDEALAPFPRTPLAIRTHTKEYYASISHLDAQIGKILDELKRTGKEKNTYIILTSDHGLAIGRHGLLGKQNVYDHSLRAPFVLLGPDIPKGKTVNEDIYIQDAMATALDIAQVSKPPYVYFSSVKPLAQGKQTESNYSEIYAGYRNSQRAIRKNGYKLIAYPKANVLELYNLEEDSDEIHNLAMSSDHQSIKLQLLKELKVLQQQMNDTLTLNFDKGTNTTSYEN